MKGILSEQAEINNQNLEKGNLTQEEWDRLNHQASNITERLKIDDRSGVTIDRLRSLMMKWKEQGVEVVILDYLGLMRLTRDEIRGTSKEQQVAYLCDNIAILAKEMEMSVIELSQLSREVERRNPPRPILSDLKDSGAIEANAVVVMFLYRPEYYEIFTDQRGSNLRGAAEIIIAKNRIGPLGSCFVEFIKEHTAFRDRTPIPQESPDSFDDITENPEQPDF